jgi:cytoskeletal protein CcmA (bactofilin family)
MSEDTKRTILEDGTEFDGSIKSKCPITVSGILRGEVSAPSLTVTQSGSVHGQVKVSQLKSQGEISGEIDAETVELSGRVSDQTTIRATTLEVMLNQNQTGGKLQVTFGNCELQVGERAAKSVEQAKSLTQENGKKEQPKPEPVPAAAGVKIEPKPPIK